MKFSIKDFFSKCDQIRRKLRIWSHLLKKSLIESFIFCAVLLMKIADHKLKKNLVDCYQWWLHELIGSFGIWLTVCYFEINSIFLKDEQNNIGVILLLVITILIFQVCNLQNRKVQKSWIKSKNNWIAVSRIN